jgi:hypothetical protein
MLKKIMVAGVVQAAFISSACAAGPYGMIHVGAWIDGAHRDDTSGDFPCCSAATAYANGANRSGSDLNQALEPAIDHALGVEWQRLRIHHRF